MKIRLSIAIAATLLAGALAMAAEWFMDRLHFGQPVWSKGRE